VITIKEPILDFLRNLSNGVSYRSLGIGASSSVLCRLWNGAWAEPASKIGRLPIVENLCGIESYFEPRPLQAVQARVLG